MTRHAVGMWCVGVGLALVCAALPRADAQGLPKAPAAPVAPGDETVGEPAILEAYALERAGRLNDAVARYLGALRAQPGHPGSWEAALGVARLSDDRAELREALAAVETPPLAGPDDEWMGAFGLARAALTARLGDHDSLPEAIGVVLFEVQLTGEVPDAFTLLLEALSGLVARSPEAGGAALVSCFEFTSPSRDVRQRGLRRVEEAVARDGDQLPALRALALLANDTMGNEARAQELEDLLWPAPAEADAEAALVRLALESRESGRQLEAELTGLKEQGAPLTIMDAVPEPVPDAENAALLYQQVFQVEFDGAEPDRPPAPGGAPSVAEVDGAIGDSVETPVGPRARQVLSGRRAQQVLDTLRRASLMPHCVFPIKWEDGFAATMPHLAKFRSAARVLTAYAQLLAEDGRFEEAIDWCVVSLRMSEHAASEPTIIAQLVSIAVQGITFSQLRETISDASVPPATAQRLDESLRRLAPQDGLRGALVAERAAVCDLYRALPEAPDWALAGLSLPSAGVARLYASALARPLHEADQLWWLRCVQQVLAAAESPYRDAAAGLAAMEEELTREAGQGLAAAVMPAYSRIFERRDRSVAEIGLCRVALALKADKHTANAYPATLDELQQRVGYPLPKDPFSGQDFVYGRRGEGFTLYSLGWDLDDDGGASADDEGRSQDDCDIVWNCAR